MAEQQLQGGPLVGVELTGTVDQADIGNGEANSLIGDLSDDLADAETASAVRRYRRSVQDYPDRQVTHAALAWP